MENLDCEDSKLGCIHNLESSMTFFVGMIGENKKFYLTIGCFFYQLLTLNNVLVMLNIVQT